MGEKVQGIRSLIVSHKIGGGCGGVVVVKNSIGNGEPEELICTAHGHELRGDGNAGGRGGAEQREIKERKKWHSCNKHNHANDQLGHHNQ